MTNDLTMIVPSRGRPQNIKRLVKAMAETITINTKLLVVIDIDDPVAAEYIKVLEAAQEWPWVSLYVQSAANKLNPILNYCAKQYAPFTDFIGFMGDDHLPRTVGWDSRLTGVLGTQPGVAYGNDKFQGAALPTAVVMTSKIVDTLGYMAPPPLQHMYLDNFWKQLGTDLDCLIYLSEVVIEHMHPVAGKAPVDDGYIRVNSEEIYNLDEVNYMNFMRNQWPTDLSRLKASL